MSLTLTPQSLKRKLQIIANARKEQESTENKLETDQADEILLQPSLISPIDIENILRHRSPTDPTQHSQFTSPIRSTSRSTKLKNNSSFSSTSPFSFALTSHQEVLHRKLFSQRQSPFPLEFLQPNLLAELFIKSRALEKYFQKRFLESDNFTLNSINRPFNHSSIPSVTFSSYMERLFRYCQPEPLHLLAIVSYSERLRNYHKIYLPPSSWHRFVVAAWIISGKALIGDQYWTNQYWAQVSGMSIVEICLLETELIVILDWRLQISSNELIVAWLLVQ